MHDLPELPAAPERPELQNAHVVLAKTRDTVQHFFDMYEDGRRRTVGAPTDLQQDLLRAALLFAASGVDAVVKHLLREALPIVLDHHDEAHEYFVKQVEQLLIRKQRGGEALDAGLMARVLTSASPRSELKETFIRDLTAGSLQSKDELLRSAACFAIKPRDLIDDTHRLDSVFRARNEIAHEMDICVEHSERPRRERAEDMVRQDVILLLDAVTRFYNAVADRLPLAL